MSFPEISSESEHSKPVVRRSVIVSPQDQTGKAAFTPEGNSISTAQGGSQINEKG